ncbi:MAG: AAA family ATPase [Verrucomicrobia bacterium]|nr:AAA family ATPase [Verrucomicrobiota bacterium]
MHIARLRISGFRGVQEADIRLAAQSVLVGPNGCGKSTLIDAISLTLGRTRMVRPLTEHDFTGSDPKAAARIKIIVTVAGFASDDSEEHDTWFRAGDRAVPKWLGKDEREYAEQGTDRKLCANVGFCARFDRDELEVISVRYFHDDDDVTDPFNDESGIVQVPPRLLNDLGFFVLPARRDWDAVASFNSDLFRRTVSNLAGIPADEILLQRDALRNPAVKIEASDKLAGLVAGLNERLARLAPNAPKFQLRVTAGDSEAVLQSLLPHYAGHEGPSLPAARHGSGLVALQSLLLLLEAGRVRMAKGLPFILALEEPELHLSPGIHGRLVAEAVATASQVICTTHSPDVARVFPATSALIVTNEAGRLAARPFLAQPLTPVASNNERKLFLQNRARVVSALMHSFVLIPEGRFDTEWLTRLSDVADPYTTHTSPFSAVFGVVPTENAAVAFTTERLTPLRSRIVAMVDGDEAGDNYVTELKAKMPPPSLIIQLPTGWTIENVVRWMLDPGGAAALTTLSAALPGFTFASLDALRDLLKTSNNKGTNTVGLKEDVLAHDAIVGVLDATPECRARVVTFCEALVSAAIGADHAQIVPDAARSTVAARVVRFTP